MDPLLIELKRRSCGPSVCGLYLGAFSHADDIRTLSTNISDCQLQINLVKKFATSQGLTLNIDKCEAVISPSTPANMTHIEVDQLQIPLTNSARCLRAWWSPSLSCKNNNIEKARRAFFARGSGVFHGKLNPLSLNYLLTVITGDLSLCARTFRSLAVSDVESLLLVRQCRFLESTLESDFTKSVLTSPDSVSLSSMKKDILQLDLSLLLSDAASHPSRSLYIRLPPAKREAGQSYETWL